MKVIIGHYLKEKTGVQVPFEVDFEQHALVFGKSGTGKSSLLKNIFVEHVRQGWGATLIDPHGDLADGVLECVPKADTNRVVVFDPLSERPLGLQFFGDAEPELAVDFFCAVIREIWPEGWGPRTEQLITAAALIILELYPKPTILNIYDFFAHAENRKLMLARSKNPLLKDFADMFDVRWDKRQREEAVAAPSNKVAKFVLNPMLRNVFGQTKDLPVADIQNTKKILVVRVPKGRIGTGTARVMGIVVVIKHLRAALQRDGIARGDRVPHLLMIDEAANFADGEVLGELFAEARKYKLSLCLVVQRLSQFKDPDEVLGSVSTEIAFRTSGKDAEVMEVEFAGKWPAARFTELANRTVLARAVIDDQVRGPHLVFIGDIVAHRPGKDNKAENVLRWSADNFGAPRDEVSREIEGFLGRRRYANELRAREEGARRVSEREARSGRADRRGDRRASAKEARGARVGQGGSGEGAEEARPAA